MFSVRAYDCFVTAVRPGDRVIDVRSISGGARFSNVSYLMPYITALGSGVDCVPQEGDRCLVLASEAPSAHAGRFVICIGFQLPTGSGGGLYLGGRDPDLPPGSVAIRAVDELGHEAKVICYRGGTLLIGSGQTATTLYSPIDSSIIHLFNTWEMIGPGGRVTWAREGGKDNVTYAAEYRVKADEEADGFRVNIEIGVDDATPVRVAVTRKKEDDLPALVVTVDGDGVAKIAANQLVVTAYANIDINAPEVTIKGRTVLDQKDPI